ncbi:MAG: hypothetical protein MI864_19210, partial [Pseudomonadales bacterium]|nr:hypothetical protein [Pseudomonadales bacterium]
LCILIGSFPNVLYQMLPYETGYWPFDVTHVLTQLQLLFFSALAFVWLNLKGLYPPELRSTNIDVEWFYRKLAPAFVHRAVSGISLIYQRVYLQLVDKLTAGVKSLYSPDRPTGYFARLWPTETMVFWVAVLLSCYLLLYYL